MLWIVLHALGEGFTESATPRAAHGGFSRPTRVSTVAFAERVAFPYTFPIDFGEYEYIQVTSVEPDPETVVRARLRVIHSPFFAFQVSTDVFPVDSTPPVTAFTRPNLLAASHNTVHLTGIASNQVVILSRQHNSVTIT